MSINFDHDAFWKTYYRAANANPITADCPPADEADSIKESAIQELTTQYIELIMFDPEELTIALLSGYEEELYELSKLLIASSKTTGSLAAEKVNPSLIFAVGVAVDSLVARHATRCAIYYLETGDE